MSYIHPQDLTLQILGNVFHQERQYRTDVSEYIVNRSTMLLYYTDVSNYCLEKEHPHQCVIQFRKSHAYIGIQYHWGEESIYRIAGNFRVIQFSRLTGKPRKLNPRYKSLNAHSRYSERPSTKITSRNLCILLGTSIHENYIAKSMHTAFPRKLDPSKIFG